MPTTKPTTYSCQIVGASSIGDGTETSAAARPRSATTRMGRRRSSTNTPRGNAKSRNGRNSTVPSRATWNALASSTTMAAIGRPAPRSVPNWLIVCPDPEPQEVGCRQSPPRGHRTPSRHRRTRAYPSAVEAPSRRGIASTRSPSATARWSWRLAIRGSSASFARARSRSKRSRSSARGPTSTTREITIACASHRAEPAQIEAVRSLLAEAPATEDDLECGEQEGRRAWRDPQLLGEARRLPRRVPRARLGDRGLPPRRAPASAGTVGRGRRRPLDSRRTSRRAVDGCGVVTFALSARRMASSFARLPRSTEPTASWQPCAVIPARRRRGLPRHRPRCAGSPAGWRRAAPRDSCVRCRPTGRATRSNGRGRQPAPAAPRSRASSKSIWVTFPSSARWGDRRGSRR